MDLSNQHVGYWFRSGSAVPNCTARQGRYVPVRQVVGTRTASYRSECTVAVLGTPGCTARYTVSYRYRAQVEISVRYGIANLDSDYISKVMASHRYLYISMKPKYSAFSLQCSVFQSWEDDGGAVWMASMATTAAMSTSYDGIWARGWKMYGIFFLWLTKDESEPSIYWFAMVLFNTFSIWKFKNNFMPYQGLLNLFSPSL